MRLTGDCCLQFLCEIDNVAYALGLGSRFQRRVSEAGRIDVSGAEAENIERGG
eukprot:SAG22_NODE_6711_length_821_cov_0.983380_2_plen_52_part_01